MKVSQAIFDYFLINEIIVIYDLHDEHNCSKSVTNDIDNVMAVINVNLQGIGNRKVIYRDTDCIFDEIVIKDNQFLRFNTLNEQDIKNAIKRVRDERTSL